jgi:hypothetical protein
MVFWEKPWQVAAWGIFSAPFMGDLPEYCKTVFYRTQDSFVYQKIDNNIKKNNHFCVKILLY